MIRIYSCGGVGDQIQAFQAAHTIVKSYRSVNDIVEVCCLARDEVYEPLKILFSNQFVMSQHPQKEEWGKDYQIITSPSLTREDKENFDEIYVVCPDLLYSAGEFSFDAGKYNTHIQNIKQIKLLTDKWTPENVIFLSLNTTTKGYSFNNREYLVRRLAKQLPEYKFYVPILTRWGGSLTGLDELNSLPENVITSSNPSWKESLEWLSKSCYCVSLDNGIYHIANQYSIPMLLLDPHFDSSRIKWWARWRMNCLNDSIPINSDIDNIVSLIVNNIKMPQTCLLPRWFVMNNSHANWKDELLIKF